MVPNRLTLRSLSATAVAVPMARLLGTSADGMAIVPSCPGNGLRWDDAAVAKFRLD